MQIAGKQIEAALTLCVGRKRQSESQIVWSPLFFSRIDGQNVVAAVVEQAVIDAFEIAGTEGPADSHVDFLEVDGLTRLDTQRALEFVHVGPLKPGDAKFVQALICIRRCRRTRELGST